MHLPGKVGETPHSLRNTGVPEPQRWGDGPWGTVVGILVGLLVIVILFVFLVMPRRFGDSSLIPQIVGWVNVPGAVVTQTASDGSYTIDLNKLSEPELEGLKGAADSQLRARRATR